MSNRLGTDNTENLQETNYTDTGKKNQCNSLKKVSQTLDVYFPNLLLLGYWSGMDLLKVPLGQQGQLQMDLWKALLKD